MVFARLLSVRLCSSGANGNVSGGVEGWESGAFTNVVSSEDEGEWLLW